MIKKLNAISVVVNFEETTLQSIFSQIITEIGIRKLNKVSVFKIDFFKSRLCLITSLIIKGIREIISFDISGLANNSFMLINSNSIIHGSFSFVNLNKLILFKI